ncbi:uncharacterized protein LOC144918367 [Branchiostoma floridae x Branchiostoma belcheri]
MNEQERPNGLYTRQTAFGNMLFTREEHSAIQAALRQRLGREFISQRPGPGNQKLTYIEGHKAVALANELFGYDGWSTFVLWTTINFVDEKAGRYNVGVHSCVRVMLKNGASQEDLGFGAADNARSKTAALEKALKESVTDGMKRALKRFGNALGNCLSDKEFLNAVMKTTKPGKSTYDINDFKRDLVDPGIENARKASLHSPTQGLLLPTPQGLHLPQAYSTPVHTAMPLQCEGNGMVPFDGHSRQFFDNQGHSRSASCGPIVPSMSAGPSTNTDPSTNTGPSTSTGSSTSSRPNSKRVPNTTKGLPVNSCSGPSADINPNISRGPQTGQTVSSVPSTSTGPKTNSGPATSSGPNIPNHAGSGPKKSISPSKRKKASPRQAAPQSRKTSLEAAGESDEAARLRKHRQWQKQQEFRQQLAKKQGNLPQATTSPRGADGIAGPSGNGVELEGFDAGMDDSLLANAVENEFWNEDESAAGVTPTGVMTRSRTPGKQGASATMQPGQEVQGQRGPFGSRAGQHGWSAQHRQPTVKKRRIDSS